MEIVFIRSPMSKNLVFRCSGACRSRLVDACRRDPADSYLSEEARGVPAASEQSERTQKPGWFEDQVQLGLSYQQYPLMFSNVNHVNI